jgi:hypothetical protein
LSEEQAKMINDLFVAQLPALEEHVVEAMEDS